MSEVVDAAVRAAFPDRVVSATASASGSDRPGNETVRVRFEDDAVAYLKVAVDAAARSRTRLSREVATLSFARRHAAVRVPRVLAADPDGDPAYVATAALAGTAIATDWPAESTVADATVLRAVGRALADVHALTFDDHATITGGDAIELDLESDTWSRVLADALDDRAEELFSDRFRDLQSTTTTMLAEHADVLDDAPAALVHDDPRPENCLVDSTGPGLVDWETALVGDPTLDVARAEAHYVERTDVDADDTDRLRRALRAGYRDHAGTLPSGFGDRYPLYRVVTFLDTARTFEHWAPDAPESASDLAAWVRDEFDARRTAIDDT